MLNNQKGINGDDFLSHYECVGLFDGNDIIEKSNRHHPALRADHRNRLVKYRRKPRGYQHSINPTATGRFKKGYFLI